MSYVKERWMGARKIIQLYNSTTTDINIASPGVAVPWNNAVYKDSDVYSHSILTNNSRITALVKGYYEVEFSVISSNQTAQRKNISADIRINGTTTILYSTAMGLSFNTTDRFLAISGSRIMVLLNVNDYIEIMCKQLGSGGASNLVSGYSRVNMTLERRSHGEF